MLSSDALLNNPVWYALTNQQADIALRTELACCYPRDMAPFGAVVANTDEAFDSLATLLKPGETVAVMATPDEIGDQWELLRQISLFQMVYDGPMLDFVETETPITELTEADVPEMLQLVELTHPGPFRARTIELGEYLSIWQDGQLAAMAGERFHLPHYREISAVCTHPDFQRRGYARALVLQLIHQIQATDEIPILHVFNENYSAQALYEALGFRARAEITLLTLKRK